jgi:AcrR family transcriptional regulator
MSKVSRETILESAEQLLIEVGPVAFEAKTLAERGDFNSSLVNYYFGGKDALITEVAGRVFLRNADDIIARVEAHEDPTRGLREFVDTMIANTHSYGAMAPLIGFQDAFAVRVESTLRDQMADEVHDAAERIGTMMFSVVYAIYRGRPYRRLNRFRMATVAISAPRVVETASLIGFAVGGYPQVWSQYQSRPIFGFNPAKILRSSTARLAADMAKKALPIPDVDDESVF